MFLYFYITCQSLKEQESQPLLMISDTIDNRYRYKNYSKLFFVGG